MLLSMVFAATQSFTLHLQSGHAVMQLGGSLSFTGKTQTNGFQDLICDNFSGPKQSRGNVVVGLVYYFTGQHSAQLDSSYGINALNLAHTRVSGGITQYHSLTNLAYRYDISHLPVYAMAKLNIHLNSDRYSFTVDAGIRPDFLKTSHYQDSPLDNMTLPDNAFAAHTDTMFSATLELGVKADHVLGQLPLECGFLFFYLGQGKLLRNLDQLLDTLYRHQLC
jgi:hypothetical protein